MYTLFIQLCHLADIFIYNIDMIDTILYWVSQPSGQAYTGTPRGLMRWQRCTRVKWRGLDQGHNWKMSPALPGCSPSCPGAVTNIHITAPVKSPLCPGWGEQGLLLISALRFSLFIFCVQFNFYFCRPIWMFLIVDIDAFQLMLWRRSVY